MLATAAILAAVNKRSPAGTVGHGVFAKANYWMRLSQSMKNSLRSVNECKLYWFILLQTIATRARAAFGHVKRLLEVRGIPIARFSIGNLQNKL